MLINLEHIGFHCQSQYLYYYWATKTKLHTPTIVFIIDYNI